MGKPRLTLIILALAFAALPKTLSASCAQFENPRANKVEILECIGAKDYFESHYEKLHPPAAQPGRSDPRKVFEGQLANQPGVVLRVKIVRFREYSEPDAKTDRFQWTSPWRRQEPAKETLLYLRQGNSDCGSVEIGAKTVFIPAPQCCDTGYLGEIGCHLDLGMMQALPADLQE
jgi:hypothetical protein